MAALGDLLQHNEQDNAGDKPPAKSQAYGYATIYIARPLLSIGFLDLLSSHPPPGFQCGAFHVRRRLPETGRQQLGLPIDPEPAAPAHEEKWPQIPSFRSTDVLSPTAGDEELVRKSSRRVDKTKKGKKTTLWHTADDSATHGLVNWASASFGWHGAPSIMRKNRGANDTDEDWGGITSRRMSCAATAAC